ncbi:MAG: HEAT repeat domain-containing protein [bacterium]|nr:HEAT repeat domain-containing protein [bacterium]
MLAGLLCFAPGDGWAAKATVGVTTGGTGRAGHPAIGQQSQLEILKRRYYLASEEERFPVLDEIRELGTDEALDFNLDLLRYPDIKVRREAVDSLKRWGAVGYMAVFTGMDDTEINWLCESIFVELGPRASSFLVDQLGHRDPTFRSRAAYLLGRINDPLAVGPLYKLLKDPDRDVRIQVIQALCDLGDERSLDGILKLFEMEDVGLADFVLQAAEKFGPRSVPALQAALKTGSVRIRSGAALALGRLRLPDTLPYLINALKDREVAVRRSVVKALDGFHHISASEGLFMALRDPNLEVQDYATTALARLNPDIYPTLASRIRDKDPVIRKNIITTLRKIGDREAVPLIISALDDTDVNVRMFAVTALIEFKDPRAIHGLINRMQSEDQMGGLISYAFMEIGESAVDELLKATGDDRFCLTRNLVILQMGDGALGTLHERARSKRNTTLRYNAIALLGELGRPESVPLLADLLQYGDVGWVAANALANMGKPSWSALRQAAGREGIVGDNARHAISQLNDPGLYLELVETLDDDNAALRRAVSEPLVAGGVDVVRLVTEKMAQLEGPKFLDSAEIICRIKDQKAIHPLNKVLFPEPWEPALLEAAQLYSLRQAYSRKGSLEPVLARLKNEMGGAGGGGGPWERVAP